MAESLHTRLLAELDDYEAAMPQPGVLIDALRAVVGLHRPVRCNWPGGCKSPLTHLICEGCGSGIGIGDCSTIQAIAEALGVKDEVLIEKEEQA